LNTSNPSSARHATSLVPTTQPLSLEDLPEELLLQVATASTAQGRCALSQVNRAWRERIGWPAHPPLELPKHARSLRRLIAEDRPHALARLLGRGHPKGLPVGTRAALNETRFDSLTPLMLGAYLGFGDICKVLLSYGADAYRRDKLGWGADDWAMHQHGRSLLASGWFAPVGDASTRPNPPPLDLTSAARAQHVTALRSILAAGVDFSLEEWREARDCFTEPHLLDLMLEHCPKTFFDEEARQKFLCNGLARSREPLRLLGCIDREGLLPEPAWFAEGLWLSACLHNPQLAPTDLKQLLGRFGPPDDLSAYVPSAAHRDDLCRIILKLDVTDLNRRDLNFQTALDVAVYHYQVDLLHRLLAAGANPILAQGISLEGLIRGRSSIPWMPVKYAPLKQRLAVISLLLPTAYWSRETLEDVTLKWNDLVEGLPRSLADAESLKKVGRMIRAEYHRRGSTFERLSNLGAQFASFF
jgi:hypothetical protein